MLKSLAATLACGVCIVAVATPAQAQTREYSIPASSLKSALDAYARQSGRQVIYKVDEVRRARSPGASGNISADAALDAVLSGTGFTTRRDSSGALAIVQANVSAFPVPGEAYATEQDAGVGESQAGDAGYQADDIIVTAQKREESVQDVPIAITALSARDLSEQKIEGGPDIMRAVPNLTFSKSNFTSYNISIRGIGTKAISATSDPGVAVSFNNVGLIHNRFFEQEFFDLERVEVLRGPQGTLYGRNATGGVINLISAKPDLDEFEGSIKGEVGNYNSRRMVGMLNVPLFSDQLALRIAGSMTQRDGYDFNSITGNRINGRDLYSIRTTLGFEPTPWLRGNVIWERFREDDNRSRTGKQLCHRDDSPDMVGSTPTRRADSSFPEFNEQRAGLFSTGCKAGSLYDDAAFGTPNGYGLAYIAGANVANGLLPIGNNPDTLANVPLINILVDPYGGMMQSRNLREIASIRDPRYRASSDILELNLDVDLSDSLTFYSQTALGWDKVYSFQDFNRFNTLPLFNDTSNLVEIGAGVVIGPSRWRGLAPGGVLCDPQIGCSDTLAVFDVSSSDSEQFSQEFRLQSSFDGPFNFSFGGNYTRFETQNDYYVMSNLLTALAQMEPFNYSDDITKCPVTGFLPGLGQIDYENPGPIESGFCPYIDPNPVESINGQGHNYFRSSNPYELRSWAAFGEAYYNLNPDLKLTAGLRYTRDRKRFTPVPSQLLLAPVNLAGGLVGIGYPANPDIVQTWGEFTGRIGFDWKPQLGFTDDTLLYAFFSRGYKAGGANPPSPGFATTQQLLDAGLTTQDFVDFWTPLGFFPLLELRGVNYGQTFEPEFVNAFEIGAKNTLMGGRLTLNAAAFFYDYKDYQVSQIRDRTAVNENFDAIVWGAELTALFEPVDNLRLNANIGWLGSRIGKGQRSIDPINRNLGDPNYTVFKPWVQLPSNCVVPTFVAEAWLQRVDAIGQYWQVCGGLGGILGAFPPAVFDPGTGELYDPADYPELNDGAGLYTDLSGNELPNSPNFTVNLGAEYTIPFDGDWSATVRGDGYWQGKSWARVYNFDPYDRLRSWTNFNLSLRINGPDGLAIEGYVKNVFNSTPITDAFLNSDDTGLTTNVFTLDPRIIGFSIAKTF